MSGFPGRELPPLEGEIWSPRASRAGAGTPAPSGRWSFASGASSSPTCPWSNSSACTFFQKPKVV